MSLLASLLLGVSVTMITASLWPAQKEREAYRFVEDAHVPRTLH